MADVPRRSHPPGGESLEALAFHLGYLGFDFEVHEPVELAEHLRRLGERLARAAGRAEAPARDTVPHV